MYLPYRLHFRLFALGLLILAAPAAVEAKNLQVDLTNQATDVLLWCAGNGERGNISEHPDDIAAQDTGAVRATHSDGGAGGWFTMAAKGQCPPPPPDPSDPQVCYPPDTAPNCITIKYKYKYDLINYCNDVKIEVVAGTFRLDKARSSSNSGCHRYYNVVK